MSNDNGLLVSDDDGVYFIPSDKLAKFKMTDAAAENIREAMDEDEVAGFKFEPRAPGVDAMKPVRFAFSGMIKPVILAGTQYSDALVE